MKYSDIIETTIMQFDQELLTEFKNKLCDKFLEVRYINRDDINKEILLEKLADYFEAFEIKKNIKADYMAEYYMNDLDEIVRKRIAMQDKPEKRGDPIPPVPRARRYYIKASSIKKQDNIDINQKLLDYSRIMLCLYMAIIENNMGVIDDFNYESSCLDIDRIIEALKNEKHGYSKRQRFVYNEKYGNDRFIVYIMTIIMYYYIKSKEVKGEH